MPRNGAATRLSILNAAQGLVMNQGFASTTVEAVIGRAGVTKGAFFHHFKSKQDLAQALVERYAAADAAHLDHTLARAEALSRDPLQQMLLFVGLMAESLDAAAGAAAPGGTEASAASGCLFASFLYEAQLFDAATHKAIADSFAYCRSRLAPKLDAIMQARTPRVPVTADGLVDAALAALEGGYVLSRIRREPRSVAAQLGHFRNYLELLFAPGV